MIDVPLWLVEALVIFSIAAIVVVMALKLLCCFKGEDDAN